jgi:NAD(P)-dependent dehydrogenase (short-subunit alcohol dehydrogenase family)
MAGYRSGAIMTVSSIYGMTGGGYNTLCNISKGDVLQLTRSIAADYAVGGIRPGLHSRLFRSFILLAIA